MDLPKYHETLIPILEVLKDGKVLHYNQLSKSVRDQHYGDLPEELLKQKTKSGEWLILNRIGWGKSYLKQAKMIVYPERAMVQITAKGLAALEKGSLSLQELRNDADFQAYEALKKSNREENTENETIDNASPQDMIDAGFSSMEIEAKQKILERLKTIDPYYFEKVILILLKKMGYGEFVETKKSGDGGIDGIVNQDQLGLEKIYIQAKRYNENKVREKEIRNFIGAMSGDTMKGVFVTTSSFDPSAEQKAREAHHRIILIDGEALADLMYQYGVGVQVRETYEVKELDEDFFEAS